PRPPARPGRLLDAVRPAGGPGLAGGPGADAHRVARRARARRRPRRRRQPRPVLAVPGGGARHRRPLALLLRERAAPAAVAACERSLSAGGARSCPPLIIAISTSGRTGT